MEPTPRVLIARELLPAGRRVLEADLEVISLGLQSTRQEQLAAIPGMSALVADLTVRIDTELLEAAGLGLQVVSNFAVGYDNIDLDACRERGVAVTNTPGVLTNATAELALALALAAARDLPKAELKLRAGEWRGWDPGEYRGFELAGATVGVVGLGRIGTRFAELVSGFGGDRLFASRRPKPEVEERLGLERVDLSELLRRSDLVSLHLPALPENHHLINRQSLALMKPTAILVNTGRGTLVDSLALAEALQAGQLGAAGLDVYEGEPEVPPELLAAPRTALAPHIGSATFRTRDAMAELAARNVLAVLSGEEPPARVA
ncbi:MAG: D-glycerate dehydrogenase [Solirubrobacterales bacterium]|nr:D-glycerate dehydrogenase [Solirubrobacterales bacterium]